MNLFRWLAYVAFPPAPEGNRTASVTIYRGRK